MFVIYLGACTSSGVMPLGPDTYAIGTSNEISAAWAKKSALKDAESFCQSKSKIVVPMNERTGSRVDSWGDKMSTYDFTFRCLAANDPDLTRAEMKGPPVDVNVDNNVDISSGVTSESTTPDYELFTELKKLDQLRKDGVLTEEEFQQQKRKVLDGY